MYEDFFNTSDDPTLVNAITHSGTFHADEVMATAILIHYARTPSGKIRFPEGIVVSRIKGMTLVPDPNVIIYDIGGGEFDHHIKGKLQYRDNGIPYASCGLIWREFGPDICEAYGIDPMVIDKNICEAIDAIDNGVSISSDIESDGEKMHVSPLSFSDIIFNMNPTFMDSIKPGAAFRMAVMLAVHVLDRELYKAMANKAAKEHINQYINEAVNSDNPDILVMDIFFPWKPIIHERDDDAAKNIKGVVYKYPRGGYQWMLVPVTPDSLTTTKVKCPNYLRGLRGAALKAVGYNDGLFIHPSGFTGRAETIETCIRMLRDIIDNQEGE